MLVKHQFDKNPMLLSKSFAVGHRLPLAEFHESRAGKHAFWLDLDIKYKTSDALNFDFYIPNSLTQKKRKNWPPKIIDITYGFFSHSDTNF